MTAHGKIGYVFGRYDRIAINGENYRYVGFEHKHHRFQLVSDDGLEDHFISFDDEHIHRLVRRKAFRRDEAYFSKALDALRLRQDNTDLSGLTEEDVRTIFWKREWCIRFNRARAGRDGFPKHLTGTHEDVDYFIETIKAEMAAWYLKEYGENRPLGRTVQVKKPDGTYAEEIKPFDYPSPSSLRSWVRAYRNANERVAAFFPAYAECGNRKQMHPEVETVIERCIQAFASLNRPSHSDIYDDIKIELRRLNAKRGSEQQLSVSRTTVNRRLAKLNPFLVEAGRHGVEAALRKYEPNGRGLEVHNFLERVEIDDWTIDLFAVICSTERWKTLTKKQRAAIPRVRCTVTVAIDVATRCIVGLNISETTPTVAGAKAALKTIIMDKDSQAAWAKAKSDWPMQGRPEQVVTDGGPVFKGDFKHTVVQMRGDSTLPDLDPSMRGYVESVNKTFKTFCRRFTGRSFGNVVEKGDYNSEAMASLTIEELKKAFIRYIVDSYHHRPHRGLGMMTPYAMWETLTGGKRAAPWSRSQELSVFGFKREKVALDSSGVMVLGVTYWTRELGLLFTKMGERQKLDLIYDPSNIGSVLVEVPKHLRAQLRQDAIARKIATNDTGNSRYLLVSSVDVLFHDMSLVQKVAIDKTLKKVVDALAREAAEKGENFRLDAHEAFSYASRQAARDGQIQDHIISVEAFDKLIRAYDEKALAATPEHARNSAKLAALKAKQAATEEDSGQTDDDETFGSRKVKGKPTGKRQVRSGQPEETIQVPAKPAEKKAVEAPSEPEEIYRTKGINDFDLDEDE